MTREKTCAQCGTRFGCGRDDDRCWCQELPPMPAAALDDARDCLCPRCLAAALGTPETDAGPAADPDPAA